VTFVLPERHPKLLHLSPYLRGDSLAAITLAGKLGRLGRVWGIDQNGVCDQDGTVWVLHWPTYRKQYPWIWTGHYVGTGPRRREVRRRVPDSWPEHVWDLSSDEVELLRSAPIGGRRPHRARVHMAHAADRNVRWILEVKHSPGFRDRAVWEQLAADRRSVRATRVGVMTLQTQWSTDEIAFEVLEHAVEVGFPVALLPRRRRPADWSTRWVMLGVRKWGSWRAKR
jgi:hypothetical protein